METGAAILGLARNSLVATFRGRDRLGDLVAVLEEADLWSQIAGFIQSRPFFLLSSLWNSGFCSLKRQASFFWSSTCPGTLARNSADSSGYR